MSRVATCGAIPVSGRPVKMGREPLAEAAEGVTLPCAT